MSSHAVASSSVATARVFAMKASKFMSQPAPKAPSMKPVGRVCCVRDMSYDRIERGPRGESGVDSFKDRGRVPKSFRAALSCLMRRSASLAARELGKHCGPAAESRDVRVPRSVLRDCSSPWGADS